MRTDTDGLKQEIRRTLDELQTLRDEIRVNVHLATLDAKDKWNELEPQLEEAKNFAREASQNARKKLTELLQRARRVRDEIRKSGAPS